MPILIFVVYIIDFSVTFEDRIAFQVGSFIAVSSIQKQCLQNKQDMFVRYLNHLEYGFVCTYMNVVPYQYRLTTIDKQTEAKQVLPTCRFASAINIWSERVINFGKPIFFKFCLETTCVWILISFKFCYKKLTSKNCTQIKTSSRPLRINILVKQLSLITF